MLQSQRMMVADSSLLQAAEETIASQKLKKNQSGKATLNCSLQQRALHFSMLIKDVSLGKGSCCVQLGLLPVTAGGRDAKDCGRTVISKVAAAQPG